MAKTASKPSAKSVVTLTHDEASRKNIPTAEYESVMGEDQQSPLRVAYERRNRDLDPQLVWRGKDEQDWSDLVVPAPPLFIQEKVHPKVLIDDLKRQSDAARLAGEVLRRKDIGIGPQIDLFADFNGLPDTDAKTEFYQHDQHWANRLILGDSLQVMASLAEREGLRGKVQCIYLDPPYGIKFNSNFQWSTTSRDVKDSRENMTREPEQVKAFRDTWRDGIHSYLTYLRDRLTVCRDLLTASGSFFVQIGDENVDKLKTLLEEVFGASNFVSAIFVAKTSGFGETRTLGAVGDYVLWFAKNAEEVKYRQPFVEKGEQSELAKDYKYRFDFSTGRSASAAASDDKPDHRPFVKLATYSSTTSQGETASGSFGVQHFGKLFTCPSGQHWKTTNTGMVRLVKAARIYQRTNSLRYVRLLEDYGVSPVNNLWTDLRWGFDASEKRYVVETNPQIVARCVLMATDPGDLVLDPTCGSGTTAYVAEQWGRRWITIDTSRVALALARARIMGARYPYYLKADSRQGQAKEAEITRTAASTAPVGNSLRLGFVYERVPHITLKSIANNAEIDVIWEKFQARLEPLRAILNAALVGWARPTAGAAKDKDGGQCPPYEEWEIPRDAGADWPEAAKAAHAAWWAGRIQRQKEIDRSIAAKAEFEYLYDKPYTDPKKVRVAGPFTVESLSPHRTLAVGADDELIDPAANPVRGGRGGEEQPDFAAMILDNLRTAGVQQAHKEDKIAFTSLTGWPGTYIGAEGRYADESGTERRAGILIGPEFGTVGRQDLVTAAREAGDAGFDVLIACAFNYEAMASEFNKLGRVPVLKARMNAELHMGTELKNTGKGNLFVIFGEPDIQILPPEDAPEDADLKDYSVIRVRINGVDVFHPNTGEVRSDGADGIACWFIDTDYNEESFFVRQAYFLGANDPYKSLKTTLKAEINEEAWATLKSDTSRPFAKPAGGRIAVKVINHLGDEVMKVFRVE